MSVRIIAGRFRGRRLETPPGNATRPLLDRIKQSLFDILGQDLTGQRVVDCCAGSGSFGCEALSRGAAEVHFIESAPAAQRCLRRNLALLEDPPGARLYAAPFATVLPGLRDIDCCFADPPFPWFHAEDPALAELLDLAAGCLAPSGQLIIRGDRGCDLPRIPAGLVEQDRRQWGRSWAAFLQPEQTT